MRYFEKTARKTPESFKDLTSGLIAGSIVGVVTHPLASINISSQSNVRKLIKKAPTWAKKFKASMTGVKGRTLKGALITGGMFALQPVVKDLIWKKF